MKVVIDTEDHTLAIEPNSRAGRTIPLYGKESLELLSSFWVKVAWNLDHYQSFSWLGRQILQLPEDLIRLQEVIYRLKPTLIIETGVKQGGSAIFFASILKLIGRGRVVAVDIRIPEGVREEVERHPLGESVFLVEGDSISPAVAEVVERQVHPDDRVFVFLDSNHGKAHVARELQLYSRLVSPDSYIVATDGVMQYLAETPSGKSEWKDDNPSSAAIEFARDRSDFIIERPPALFNDQRVIESLTYFPSAWLKRLN